MKHFKMVLALALAAFLLPIASASAATAPGYEEFSDCPDRSVDPTIAFCNTFEASSGHLQMGSKNVPITDPITITIGVGGSGAVTGAFDGGRQPVPGGVIGITGLDWLSWLFPFSLLTLHGEAELAGPITGQGGDIGLPLKVRLASPVLRNSCYVGSDANPIDLDLTTGTTSPPPPNEPISGQSGTLAPDPVLPNVLRSTGITLVDNAFAVPGANGCDLIGLGVINGLVNLTAGLPSAAGTNETVQNAESALAAIAAVYPPAGIEQ